MLRWILNRSAFALTSAWHCRHWAFFILPSSSSVQLITSRSYTKYTFLPFSLTSLSCGTSSFRLSIRRCDRSSLYDSDFTTRQWSSVGPMIWYSCYMHLFNSNRILLVFASFSAAAKVFLLPRCRPKFWPSLRQDISYRKLKEYYRILYIYGVLTSPPGGV